MTAPTASILDFVSGLGEEPVARPLTIVIDGPSGSGKTQTSDGVVSGWPRPGETPQLLRMDDVYPGWDGLEAGAELIVTDLLTARARGEDATILTYDWMNDVVGPYRTFAAGIPLIIEGCGSLTAASRPLVDFAIWLEAPADQRKKRAIERDGERFAVQWDNWAAQEAVIFPRERPWTIADQVFYTGT